jgi:hypothetical protein
MYKFINGIKPNPIKGDFDEAMDNLLNNINTDYHKGFPSNKDMVLSLVAGSKFVKVVNENSVWGFVAKKDGVHKGLPMKAGDVLKAASWRAPAKHTRGNIFDKNQNYFRWTGPDYL